MASCVVMPLSCGGATATAEHLMSQTSHVLVLLLTAAAVLYQVRRDVEASRFRFSAVAAPKWDEVVSREI